MEPYITQGESGDSIDYGAILSRELMNSKPSDAFMQFLAPARVAGYRDFLKIYSDQEIKRAYVWNYALSSVIFPMLGCIEMLTRDATHRAMARHFAPTTWTKSALEYPWYDNTQLHHYPLIGKGKQAIDEILYDKNRKFKKSPQPKTDDVIAGLTFGYWTNLFRSLTPVDAPKIIPQIFPNHPIHNAKRWGDPAVKTQLLNQIQVTNNLRNRLAHHEPLFKFRFNGSYPKNLAGGLKNLRECMDQCLELGAWIDPHATDALRQTSWFTHFQELSTSDCFSNWVRNGLAPTLQYAD